MIIIAKFWTRQAYHQLKIKEALHKLWEMPILNKQAHLFDISLNFYPSYILYNSCRSFVRL